MPQMPAIEVPSLQELELMQTGYSWKRARQIVEALSLAMVLAATAHAMPCPDKKPSEPCPPQIVIDDSPKPMPWWEAMFVRLFGR